MKRLLTLLLLFISLISLRAEIPPLTPNKTVDGLKEGKWVIWYTDKLNQTFLKDSVNFYEIINFKSDKPNGIAVGYYKSGKKLWEHHLVSFAPKIYDGLNIWYYPDGKKMIEIEFRNGVKNGKSINYYSNGNIEKERTYKNDLREGKQREYFENGSIKTISEYLHGKDNGKTELYYESGQIKTTAYYKNGLKEGEWTFYYENGKPSYITHFINDIGEGEDVQYYENGNLKTKTYLKNGNEEGHYILYYENGNIELDNFLSNGIMNGTSISYFEDGTEKMRGNYINGKKDSLWKYYDENGNKTVSINFTNDIRNGKTTVFYDNGKIKNIIEYKDGKMNGKYESFYENGQLNETVNMFQDKENGKGIFYYQNGNIYKTADYKNGQETGKISTYYENGNPKQISEYDDDGKSIGDWIWYYENGNKLATATYKNNLLDGELITYFSNKQINESVQFINGLEDGDGIKYYPNGQIKTFGRYAKGKRINSWTYYKENGDTIFTEYYDQNYYQVSENLNQVFNLLQESKSSEALSLALKTKEFVAKHYGETNTNYAYSLQACSSVYSMFGNNSKAFNYAKQSLQIQKDIFGENSTEYAQSLSSLAQLYSDQQDYATALKYTKQVLELRKKLLGEKSRDYASSLSNIANIYFNMKDENNAISYYKKSVQTTEDVFGKNSTEYLTTLNRLASIYLDRNETNSALDVYKQAFDLYNNLEFKFSTIYALMRNNIAYIYSLQQKRDSALIIYLQNKDIFKQSLGETNESYSFTIKNIAYLNIENKQYRDGIRYLTEYFRLKTNECYENLNGLETNFISQGINQIRDEIKMTITYCGDDFITTYIPKQSYISLNAFKGLQLYSYNSQRQKLLNNPNDLIRNLYINLLQLQDKQNGLDRSIPDFNSKNDKLQEQIDRISVELSKHSEEYAINFKVPTLDMIQSHIANNEVFIDYYIVGQHYYGALIRPSGDIIWKQLEFSDQLQQKIITAKSSSSINQLYTSKDLYNALLKPFEEYLNNKKLIVSPDGILHNVAFQAIPVSEGKTLADVFQVKEISSSRSLYIKEKPLDNLTADIFGGIVYDYADQQVVNKQKQEETKNDFLDLIRGSSTGDFKYLPGTKEETDAVADILQTPANNLLQNDKATEFNFRNLSSQNPEILMISTHGFYLPQKEQDNNTDTSPKPILLDNNIKKNVYKAENDPMLRSGLALYGANESWLGRVSLPADSDGILLAKEIASVDLSNTRLVVLSACQTALGDISRGEGVFGIQRAFKQAGVEYIVASLWEVPDNDTKELMISFFTHLKQTKNPDIAISLARNDMKTTGKTPYQYQGFILIR